MYAKLLAAEFNTARTNGKEMIKKTLFFCKLLLFVVSVLGIFFFTFSGFRVFIFVRFFSICVRLKTQSENFSISYSSTRCDHKCLTFVYLFFLFRFRKTIEIQSKQNQKRDKASIGTGSAYSSIQPSSMCVGPIR